MKSLVVAAVAAALPLVSANAEIITVRYEATLNGPSELGWPEGVLMVGTFAFDSEALSQGTDTQGSYPLLDYRMTLNGTPFIGNSNSFVVTNDQRTLDPRNNTKTGISSTLSPQAALTVLTLSHSAFTCEAFLVSHRAVR
jgi:hypothetical protein